MSDVIARRQARIRRILENSQSRLEKIKGRNEENTEGHQILHPPPQHPYEYHFQEHQFSPEPRITLHPQFLPQDNNVDLDDTIVNETEQQLYEVPNLSDSQQESVQNCESSKIQTLQETKIHLILLAILIYFVFAIKKASYLFGSSVFMPLLLWEVCELFLYRNNKEKPGMLGLVFVMSGLRPERIKVITTCLQITGKICKDLFIYFFVFVSCHIFWQKFVFCSDAEPEY